MVIGVDIRTLLEPQYRGVSEYTFNLLRNILEQDKTNKYVLFYNTARPEAASRLPEFAQPNVWLTGRSWPNKFFNASCKFLDRPRIDSFIRQPIDLWWMPHFNYISLPSQARSLLTVHDLSFLRYPEFFSVKDNLWHWGLSVKKSLKKFDHLVAISHNTKRDLLELAGLPENKVSVIYSGLSEQYRPVTETDRLARVKQKYNLPNKFILYLGTLEPRKNIESLILAFNDLRSKNQFLFDYELVIAGGPGWKYGSIYSLAEQSPYRGSLRFLNYVPEEDKASLYTLASLFVFPSFYEGFGFPPLEAAACGTPVITSFASSLLEVMGEAALLVDPYDIGQISLAMQQVLTNHYLAQSLRERGLLRAQEFQWQKTAESYVRLFQILGLT